MNVPIRTASLKKFYSPDSSIQRVINLPLTYRIKLADRIYQKFTYDPLLHLICSNQLGIILEFIFKVSESVDIFYTEDDYGNTPLHLLCKRVDQLKGDYNLNDDNINSLYRNFTSEPTPEVVIKIIDYLSDYIDFSIKNKYRDTPGEVTENIFIHNIIYRQMIKKKIGKFPLNKPNIDNEDVNYRSDWNVLFNFKNPKQNNKSLLHFICMGDRLSAIKFLIDLGADVNKPGEAGLDYKYETPIFKLFKNYSDGNVNIKLPSGFRRVPKININKLYDTDLYEDESNILEESEKMAEYLIECGAAVILENNYPYCDISDIMYRIFKEKIKENSNNNNNGNNNNNNKDKGKDRNTSIISSLNSTIIEIAKNITNGFMKFSCFPFGNYPRYADFDDINDSNDNNNDNGYHNIRYTQPSFFENLKRAESSETLVDHQN